MVLYIGIYIESDWLYHAEWVALSNGQSGSELAEYSWEEMYERNGQNSASAMGTGLRRSEAKRINAA